jgi:aspartate racemase
MHRFAEEIARASAPAELIHIGDCAAAEALHRGCRTVALMGTRFTMEENFYTSRLENAGLKVLLPSSGERAWIDDLIFRELCAGTFKEESRRRIAEITSRLADRGAEAVVLGCTELPLILTPGESALPLVDTMEVHVIRAVETALKA